MLLRVLPQRSDLADGLRRNNVLLEPHISTILAFTRCTTASLKGKSPMFLLELIRLLGLLHPLLLMLLLPPILHHLHRLTARPPSFRLGVWAPLRNGAGTVLVLGLRSYPSQRNEN